PETDTDKDALCTEFHADRANCRNESHHTRLKRGETETKLKHQRQQKRNGANPEPEDAAADNRCAEYLIIEKLQVQQRVIDPLRMLQIQDRTNNTNRESGKSNRRRQSRKADY